MKTLRSTYGFTLLEIVTTIAIMAILLAISTLTFHPMQVKANIEAETRQLFTDISEAHTNAFTQKKVYGILFQPRSYVMKTYTSEVEYLTGTAAAANGNVVLSKSLNYSITKSGNDITDTYVVFDTIGFANNFFTIFVGSENDPAALNCVVISAARVNMGKINGANCDFR